MGEGGWLVTFSSNKCHSTCIVISDTSPCISRHIRLLDSFPSFLIFGSERETDLEVAAGIGNMVFLVCSVRSEAVLQPFWVILRAYQL